MGINHLGCGCCCGRCFDLVGVGGFGSNFDFYYCYFDFDCSAVGGFGSVGGFRGFGGFGGFRGFGGSGPALGVCFSRSLHLDLDLGWIWGCGSGCGLLLRGIYFPLHQGTQYDH